MLSFITPTIWDFIDRAVAAGIGSLLASVYLFLRAHHETWEPSRIRAFLIRQVMIAIVSGLIVAGTAGIGTPRLAFVAGVFFPVVLSPITEGLELERNRKSALLESRIKAEQAVQQEPEKAKPKWDLATASLELYVDRNLQQVRHTFWITIAVMAAGMSLVVYGVWRAYDKSLDVAILAAASGVLTQAIAATFLLIYRSTMTQASAYVGMLERINSVGMAVEIVDMIPEDNKELKNKARADLVREILASSKPSSRGNRAGAK